MSFHHVGINAQLLAGGAGYRRAGIHHYIRQVLRHLPADEQWRYTAFGRQHTAALLAGSSVGTAITRWPTERRLLRIAWEQLAWPVRAAVHGFDLLHSMAFVTPLLTPAPAVVTVYDLSFLLFPERFPPLQRLYLSTQTRRSVRSARRVVAISQSGRRDVIRLLGVPPERVDVVTPGVDDRFRPLAPATIAAFRRERRLPERFVLHVGTLQPRKNIPTLIDAMALLKQPDLHLLLVGGKGWLYDEIFARVTERGLEDQVHFAGYVPDGDLPLWYNAAEVLAFPSIYEGFGLPVVEALACGTPVVAADSSAIPEAAGDAGLLFPPRDAAALADRLADVLDRAGAADTIRERGLAHARHFTWSRAGESQLAVYRRALEE